MLNDFGFAVSENEHVSFAGTIRYAPNCVLKQLVADPNAAVEANCSHDLESAVKLITTLAWNQSPPHGDYATVFRAWEEGLVAPTCPPVVPAMLKLASDREYRKLSVCMLDLAAKPSFFFS